MKLHETKLAGCFLIEPTVHADERGLFARVWDRELFARHGLDTGCEILAVTQNKLAGTLRGMHYQHEPFAESKLVRVTRGAIYDVALDLRPASPTFKQWHAVELSAENRRMFFIPRGCAHGYLTLADDSELCYVLSNVFAPDHAAGVRYNDPAFNIAWPGEVQVINDRDASYADFK